MSSPVLKVLMGLTLLAVMSGVRAQLIALDPAIQGEPLGSYLSYWQDSTGNAVLADAMAQQDWQGSAWDVPNFGLESRPVWFRLELQASDLSTPWLIDISYNLLDYVSYFLVNDSGQIIDQRETGMLAPRAAMGYWHRTFLIPLQIDKPGVVTLYFRVQSFHALQFPLMLWPTSTFVEQDEIDNLVLGLFFGVMCILLLYNFFLYAVVGDTLYAYFAAMIMSVAGFHCVMRGVSLRWLPWLVPEWNSAALMLVGMLTIFFSTLCADRFLKIGRGNTVFARQFRTLRWFCLASGLLSPWMTAAYGVYLLILLAVLSTALVLYAIAVRYNAKDRALRLFTMGWVLLVLGVISMAANKLAILPYNALTEHAISVFTLIELMLFSMAISESNNVQKEKILVHAAQQLTAQEQQREMQLRQLRTEEMERNASEISLRIQNDRNEQLSSEIGAFDQEIESINQQLHDISRIDSQTGVFNRASFNDQIREEVERMARAGQMLSLMLVGVDEFHGHARALGIQASDDLLRQSAELLVSIVSPYCAAVFRFDSATFALLVPSAAPQQVEIIAEAIRAGFDHQVFQSAGKQVAITVCVGLVCQVPAPGSKAEQLVGMGEQALLAARGNGTNSVHFFVKKAG